MIGAGILAQSMNSNMQRGDLMDQRSQALIDASKGPMDKDKIHKIAVEFESMFISQMLEHMMVEKSFGDDGDENALAGGDTDEIYKSMMVNEYGKAITKAGGIGIAAHIERTLSQRALLHTQEVGYATQTQQ